MVSEPPSKCLVRDGREQATTTTENSTPHPALVRCR